MINQKFFADGSYHIKNFLDNESKEVIKEVIFESFQQADSSHTRDFDGLGLGLTLASGLLKLHGSKLELESKPGGGSCFSFELETVST